MCSSLFVCIIQVLQRSATYHVIFRESRDPVSVPASFGGVVLFLASDAAQTLWQQMLQRGVVQFVDGHDMIQMLQVTLLVSHEVRDSGPLERRQVSQPLHVFVGHL